MSASVTTVLGELPAEELGITLCHEHLAMKPGDLVKYSASFLDDTEKMIQEVSRFTGGGGETLVEMSVIGFRRDPHAYQEISENTGVQVVCATGFSKEEMVPDRIAALEDAAIFDLIIDEVENGIKQTPVKPGVIKVGTSYNEIRPLEKRLIAIVSRVHKDTGLPISTHTDRGTMAEKQAQLFVDHGANPDQVILGHVDIPNDTDYLERLCKMGFNVGIDHVGRDREEDIRVKIPMIRHLIDRGYIENIFISGDMGKKDYLICYGGGPGLGYIPTELSGQMLASGIKDTQLDHILRKNPRRVLPRRQ